ncbi:ATP-dependent Clp protease, protease subunit [Actinopolymorpha cephalotaxi]|uniref:ATP-dependent Clp protease proteolytic subunit n=1 Tax=Actinopolymorpha cephalotaxi TaxID=504797 RepID=A0A1I2K9I4_9ACTN|nr:ATP-dependent Clp protease proteolytic subunit [Actinopolymorpha cephalotaxi]NYH84335.1 ATP-dependent Clp protease protease subunit [Actinopolymorpha cephalotaxi]SFF63073.1 ATP-dependent Clp protease, protease subunit [Actinopolymorpha cephalotaxi]
MAHYTIPNVIERTHTGERATDLFSRLLSERIIFLGTEIDADVANVVMAQLIHLEAASPSQDISLYINSPGGSFSALMGIYDTMQFVLPDVSTMCLGQASSAATVLLAGGAPGKRLALRHSRIALHQPATRGQGALSDLQLQAAEVARVRTLMLEVLNRHTGRSIEALRADTDRERVFDAEEARAYGLIDEVLVYRGDDPDSL